ncbi:MAG: hypothetical protein GXO20_06185 [Thermodesulfobacteria bacterium]|nr:hypothetical protein [Thermodesulfobacteriota bacterium]
MKNPAGVVVISVLLALFVGWAIGSFFTETSVSKAIASIPASPIVIDAKYDREEHSIVYSILNPGGMPETIVQQAFVFKPGKETREKGYVVSNIPVHITLPPGETTEVIMKLKAGTEKLHLGDVVLATFTYVHPLSTDLYTVVHPFEMGAKKASKAAQAAKAQKEASSQGAPKETSNKKEGGHE